MCLCLRLLTVGVRGCTGRVLEVERGLECWDWDEVVGRSKGQGGGYLGMLRGEGSGGVVGVGVGLGGMVCE